MLAEPPATSYLWRDVARDLEREWRTFMPDLIGTGASERPAARRGYAIDAQANALAGLLDVLGLPRVAVVASGIAGAVAVELAARQPQRVAALVLIGAVVHGDAWPTTGVLPLLPVGPGEAIFTMLRGRGGRGRRRVASLLGADPAADLDHYVEPLRSRPGAKAMLRVFRTVDMQVLAHARELVGVSPPPTLVLWGEDDRLLSLDYGRRVAAQFGATWVPVPETGHLVARERPERVAEEIAGFLADLA